jgi:hypothetical protein
MGAQQAKLNAYLRTTSFHGTPSTQLVYDYDYPFALEDGGRLAPMAVDLADRLAILVAVRSFPSMGAADSHSLGCIRYRFANASRIFVQNLAISVLPQIFDVANANEGRKMRVSGIDMRLQFKYRYWKY